jgi:hypothetical protein
MILDEMLAKLESEDAFLNPDDFTDSIDDVDDKDFEPPTESVLAVADDPNFVTCLCRKKLRIGGDDDTDMIQCSKENHCRGGQWFHFLYWNVRRRRTRR